MTSQLPELRVTQACDDGRKFAEIFYEKLDKNRTAINGLYLTTANLVWNGNFVQGKDKIVSFYENLPSSETNLMSVDAQPMLDLPEFMGQVTITVICGGRMKIGTRTKFFSECFMLTAENQNGKPTWKIVSDTYRDFV